MREIFSTNNFVFRQISGTAAKLGQPNAYHHCTLLVDTNKNDIRDALAKDEVNGYFLICNFEFEYLNFNKICAFCRLIS